ncbi:asparagine synthase-related protein [Gryllotalpicola ginsengisoli]|uniref:asparagine synthase-related protein n=1 Tax=Gryllotalpicola ginsengisoli TaxID=444608 RepID=UPI0003B435E3|nr:asparagine synthase C-terminal domain-containing protein [Gryllotalpicola ginsengisoli]
MSALDFIRVTPDEVAFGVLGGMPASAVEAVPGTAREVLEEEIASAFGPAPVFVSFSGGRDSSAVLAVATSIARRRGMPDPIPVIRRYPGDPDSDETAWQELVLDHLGLSEPVIVEVTRRSTYLDDAVQANLRTRGLLWPPALQLDDPTLPIVAGGMLLTGEGGDEVLGTRRITPLTLLRLGRRPTRRLLAWAWASVRPRRSVPYEEEVARTLVWLTEEGRQELAARLRAADTRPLHWGRETLQLASRRMPAMLTHNYQAAVASHGVSLRHPLLAPRFLAALAQEGGRWGFAGRTALMRHLFSDVLPDELLARSTKAHFGAVRWGERERRFARDWDGTGLPEWIDPERIRVEWMSERPAGASALALHAAWLSAQGLAVEWAA